MSQNENICLVDLDGTCADFSGQLDKDLALLASPDEKQFDIYGEEKWPIWFENRVKLIKRQTGWWENLEVLSLGKQILDAAYKIGFNIHVLTKGPKTTASAWTEKLVWCQKNIPYPHKVTITEDKGLVYGKVLVDDFPDYMDRWLKWRPRGLGIMPVNNYNLNFRHPNVLLYDGNNHEVLVEKLKTAFER